VREGTRFRRAKNPEILQDHAINIFWTSWHLHERVWREICELNDEQRAHLASSVGATWKSKEDFRDWAKQKCLDLGALRQLTNLSKHTKTGLAPDEVLVDVTAGPTMVISGSEATNPGLLFQIKVGDGDEANWESADAVFSRVVAFWKQVIALMGLALAAK
jgi:hypothetical protein